MCLVGCEINKISGKVALIFNYNYYIKKGSKYSSDLFFLIFLITPLPSP